jgi:hypothetical protein
VCVGFRNEAEIGSQANVMGTKSSARDAAFQAVAKAASLAQDLLPQFNSNAVKILTADHHIL